MTKRARNNFLRWLKRRLLGGVLVVLPVLVTFWLAGFLYVKLTGWAVTLVQHFAPGLHSLFWVQQAVRVATLLLIIIILLLVGEFMRYKSGRLLAHLTELVLLKVPILRSVYVTSRQIGEALWTPKGNMFRQVVLIEYPRRGIYTLGFLTNENRGEWELSAKTGSKLLSIFVPTTPNPTSGFLLFLPREDCIFLDMKVSEGMKLVISGGISSGANPAAEKIRHPGAR
ncbi:MAG: DUF502 domain-containing protein [Victivallaceae bacterium]|nr:DUF502 domain-containing protein [Victivallaceae bacterium]